MCQYESKQILNIPAMWNYANSRGKFSMQSVSLKVRAHFHAFLVIFFPLPTRVVNFQCNFVSRHRRPSCAVEAIRIQTKTVSTQKQQQQKSVFCNKLPDFFSKTEDSLSSFPADFLPSVCKKGVLTHGFYFS